MPPPNRPKIIPADSISPLTFPIIVTPTNNIPPMKKNPPAF
jgi:hypothetical protein